MLNTKKSKLISLGLMSALIVSATLMVAFSRGLGNAVLGQATSLVVTAVDEATRTESVSSIDVNNGTIRMVATIEPETASNKTIVWEVEDITGSAWIDRCGQLIPYTNGTVLVKGSAQSNLEVFDTMIITITNQLEPIELLSSEDFTILAATGISSGGVDIKGDIGANTADAITGFGLLTMDTSNEFSTSEQVDGNVYLPGYQSPTPAKLTSAIGDSGSAYTIGSLLVPPLETELYAGDIGGHTLEGGIYKWSNSLTINTSLILEGDASEVWIFQIAGGVTQLAGTEIILSGGARPENVFWLTATTISIGAGCHFEGIALSSTNITVGANSSVEGRLLAQTRVDLGAAVSVVYPGYVS